MSILIIYDGAITVTRKLAAALAGWLRPSGSAHLIPAQSRTLARGMAPPTGQTTFTRKQWVMIVAPVVLVPSMYAAFQGLVALLGHPSGYLLAFLIYWVGWCVVLPMAVLGGPREVLNLFRVRGGFFSQLGWHIQVALWWPIIVPLAFRFIPRFHETSSAILAASIALGLVIGPTEEILWRGVYHRLFPRDLRWNTLYPTVMFALWHAAPLAIQPNRSPDGMASFLLYAVLLGLSYAYYTRKTGSIRWATVSHCVHDTFGLGGYAYVAWLGS